MAFANSNDYLTGRKNVPNAVGSEVIAVRYQLELATGDLALNDVGAIGILPANHIPLHIDVFADDLDSNETPALVTSIGVLNAAEDNLSTAAADGGAVWLAGLTVGQAAGAVGAQTSVAINSVTASGSDRKIGVKVTTAAATAAAGTYGIVLYMKAA